MYKTVYEVPWELRCKINCVLALRISFHVLNKQLYSSYYEPGTVLSTLHKILTPLIFLIALGLKRLIYKIKNLMIHFTAK